MCNEGLEPLVRLLLRMWSDKSLFFSFFFFPFSFLANVHLLYIDIITWGVRSAISFFLFFSFFLLFLQKTNFYIPVSLVLSPKERIRYTPRAHVLDNPNISPSSNTSLHPSSSSSPLPSSSIRKLTNPDKEEKNCQLIIIIKLVHAQCPLSINPSNTLPSPSFPLSSSETAVLLSPLNSPSWEVGGKRCSDSGAASRGGSWRLDPGHGSPVIPRSRPPRRPSSWVARSPSLSRPSRRGRPRRRPPIGRPRAHWAPPPSRPPPPDPAPGPPPAHTAASFSSPS